MSRTAAKRQASLAGFFSPQAKRAVKKEGSPDIVLLEGPPRPGIDNDVKPQPDPASKTKIHDDVVEARAPLDTGMKVKDDDKSALQPVAGPSRPRSPNAYRPPPTPTYNHPFPIPPVPASLELEYNTVPRVINSPDSLDLLYFDRFIAPSCARQLTKYLLDSLPWYRVKYTVRGININTPRFTTVFGKDETGTSWAGYKVKPRAIPDILLRLKAKGKCSRLRDRADAVVEEVTGETYNFTLVNYYASGTDSISYHSDSESFLGPNPCIASISLGAPRDFMLRHVKHKTLGLPVQKFSLHDGDMVVMRGRTQHDWEHSIPKRKNADGRINITFRRGRVKYATVNYNTYNVGTGPMYRWNGAEMVEQAI